MKTSIDSYTVCRCGNEGHTLRSANCFSQGCPYVLFRTISYITEMVDDGSVFRLFLIKRENGGALADVQIRADSN